MYCEQLELRTVVADTFQDLFHIVHESIVKNWLHQSDVAKVSLAVASLSTSLARKFQRIDTKSEVVWS